MEKAKQLKKIELDKKAQAEKRKKDQEEEKNPQVLAALVDTLLKGILAALESANNSVQKLMMNAKQAITSVEIVLV